MVGVTGAALDQTTIDRLLGSLKVTGVPQPPMVAGANQRGEQSPVEPDLSALFQKAVVRRTSGGWQLLKSRTGRCTFEMPVGAGLMADIDKPNHTSEVFRFPRGLDDTQGKLALNLTRTDSPDVQAQIDRKFALVEQRAQQDPSIKVRSGQYDGYSMREWEMPLGTQRNLERAIYVDGNTFVVMTALSGQQVTSAMIDRFLESAKIK
jgi:hypothetical protein